MSPQASPTGAEQATQDTRKRRVHAEQIRLLYTNANTGVWVTICVAGVLSYLQWGVISHSIILPWLAYMLVTSSVRFTLARRYWGAAARDTKSRAWADAFAIGTGFSAMGWGAAGVLLYPEASLTNQVILAFVLGGMILGAGSVLASRPEAFLAFIIPAGLPVSARFFLQGDDPHRAMGLLGAIFSAATSITTWRIYLTVRASLCLRVENADLVVDHQKCQSPVRCDAAADLGAAGTGGVVKAVGSRESFRKEALEGEVSEKWPREEALRVRIPCPGTARTGGFGAAGEKRRASTRRNGLVYTPTVREPKTEIPAKSFRR